MNVIGLGQAGCAIAEKFGRYPQYKVFKMDVGLKGKGNFDLPLQDHPEKYEENCPVLKIRSFLKGVKGDVLFVCSCGNSSGAALRILEQLKNRKRKITILYIQPEQTLLSELQSRQDNLMFGVMQEYARSGALEDILLISNEQMSAIIGDVPVREYYDRVNEAVVSTYHMINVFKNLKTEMDTFSADFIPSLRIGTLGIVDLKSGEEKLFFPLDKTRDKRYYYAVPEKVLKEDGKLLNRVIEQVKNKVEHEKMKTSFGIYSTQYEDSLVYSLARASMVQTKKNLEI